MSVEDTHDLKDTMVVEVETPGHVVRGAPTALFVKTKKLLMSIARVLGFIPNTPIGRCFICNATEEELGHPLEAHHIAIEWSFSNAPIDWNIVAMDFPNFDWKNFDPANPLSFVDDMVTQGILLCKPHHTGKDCGIHNLPFSLWIMQRYLKDGYKFSDLETIHRERT